MTLKSRMRFNRSRGRHRSWSHRARAYVRTRFRLLGTMMICLGLLALIVVVRPGSHRKVANDVVGDGGILGEAIKFDESPFLIDRAADRHGAPDRLAPHPVAATLSLELPEDGMDEGTANKWADAVQPLSEPPIQPVHFESEWSPKSGGAWLIGTIEMESDAAAPETSPPYP